MNKKLADFISIWNHNIPLVYKSHLSIQHKTHEDLLDFCIDDYLKKYKTIPLRGFILYLKKERDNLSSSIKDFDGFEKYLHKKYHIKSYPNKSANRKYIYENQASNGFELKFKRNLIIQRNSIKKEIITQQMIDAQVVNNFSKFEDILNENGLHYESSFFLNSPYEFVFFQLSKYNNSIYRIKKWFDLFKKNRNGFTLEKLNFLIKLYQFFKKYNKLNFEYERLELWFYQYKKDDKFEFFEEYFEAKNKNTLGENLINLFKMDFLNYLINDFEKRKGKSINLSDFIKSQIKENNDLLNKPPENSWSSSHIKYNEIYSDLVNGNRENYYSKIRNSELAGRTEGIQEFIKYLEGLTISKKRKQNILKPHSLDAPIIPIEIFENTRGYLKKNAQQVIICYKYKAYDACFVILRKIIEILIIELYEKKGIEEKIIDGNGNYFMLKKLIFSFEKEKQFKKIVSRNINDSLPKIKRSGDLSAHNRKYNARKSDIDRLRDDFRVVFEELIHSIY